MHRLLLVEDDTGEVALLRSMLAEEAETAFTLDWVPGMLAAITVVTNQPSRFDALLVNVRLSDGGGLELIADLQRRGIDIPVLLVSTFHDAELERQALRLGAADYLTRHEMVPLALRRAIRNAVERHALTRELRDSERRYRTLAGSFPRGCVLLFDHRGQLLLADGEASSQLGLVGPAAIGRQITELLPDMAADLTSAAFDRLRNRPLFEGRHGDRWYLVSLRRLELDGMPSQLLVVLLDITELKSLQLAAVVNDRMSLLGELAGGLAHEFNNLHSVILGAADRLAHRRSLGNELRVPIELIRSTTERAAGITHQLLQFAKADNDAPLSTCDLGGTVRETLAIVRSELESYGIRTELDLPHLPLVMMPRAAIGQVVMNLVINARDALRGREAPLIRLTCRQVATSAMLLVEDNGPGVPEAIAPRIFDPFFTTKDGRDGRSPGTGIGLSLCRNLLERMGGTIVHERPVGSGCRFVITIPLRPAGLDWLATSGKEDELAVLPDDASILVAAPERQLRELLCDELLEAGLISHGASDSANAASIMSAIVVQAVLVDYDWPEARAIVDAATAREQQPLIIGFGCGPLDDGLRGRLSAVCSKPPDMSRIRLILSMGLMRRKV